MLYVQNCRSSEPSVLLQKLSGSSTEMDKLFESLRWGARVPVVNTLMHSTFPGEGQHFVHRGHRAFSGQRVGISTVGASSISTLQTDVSTATQTAGLFVSMHTLPEGR